MKMIPSLSPKVKLITQILGMSLFLNVVTISGLSYFKILDFTDKTVQLEGSKVLVMDLLASTENWYNHPLNESIGNKIITEKIKKYEKLGYIVIEAGNVLTAPENAYIDSSPKDIDEFNYILQNPEMANKVRELKDMKK